MLRVLSLSTPGLTPVAPLPDWRLPDDAVWIDLATPSREEELAVERALGFELPTRDEMAEIEASSRLYQEHGATVMIASLLINSETDDPVTTPVTFALIGHRLVTIRYAEPRAFALFAAQVERQPDTALSGVQVFISLLDAIVDRLADILERTSGQVEMTSRAVFRRPRGATFEDIIGRLGRAQIVDSKVRDSLVSISRLLSFGSLADQIEGDRDNRDHMRSLQRDVQSLTDHAGHQSSNITFLLDAAMGLINIEQNAILTRFTILTIMLMGPTLVAGVYGMNFEHMPELRWMLGYPFAVFVMLVAAIAPLAYFRLRRWI